MALCPAGHESAADDYCDACGRRMGEAPTGGEPTPNAPAGSGPPQPSCPVCHTPRSGRFCEVCRFDFVAGAPTALAPGLDGPGRPAGQASGDTVAAPPAAAGGPAWSAVVTADRAYFDRVIATGGPGAADIPFPAYYSERRFALGRSRPGEQKRIGRHSASRGIEPEIDLTGPPTDPGVSRLHAVLIGQPEGGWAVLDPGSENGTLVNDQEITAEVPVPLHDGDRINIGAWTVITICRA
jgi:FHA domain